MLRTMSRSAIASIVGFFLGCAFFLVVRPIAEVARPEPPAPQVLSITLKRYGCTDSELKCPVYDVTFRSDGRAALNGYANDDFIGNYKGTLEQDDFAYMVEQIRKQQFFELPLHYTDELEDEKISLEVETSDSRRQITTYSWSSTPAELRTLQALVAEQGYHVYWEEDK